MSDQKTIMKRAAWATIAIGIFFAASALPVLHPAVQLFLKIAHWPYHSLPSELSPPSPLLVAISGGLMTGMGGMLWALGHYVSPISEEATRRVTLVAAWSWFCTDSIMSNLVGAPMNVAINALFLALMLFASKESNTAQAEHV
ncbi:MAG: hypothetical protein AAGA08_20550 [Pseudomonadota bacterium]